MINTDDGIDRGLSSPFIICSRESVGKDSTKKKIYLHICPIF